MKKQKKTARILLLLLAFCMVSVSCSVKEEKNNPVQADKETTPAEETAAETEYVGDKRRIYPDSLPDEDLGGYGYRICTSTGNMHFFCADELTGEVLNDSIFQRNSAVEKRYNTDLQFIDFGLENYYYMPELVEPFIMAGDDFADLFEVHCVTGANLSLKGVLRNLYELEYVDFTQPWWFPQSVEEMTYMGKMFLGNSAISYEGLASVSVHYVNLDMWNAYGLYEKWESIYNLVEENHWTLDKLVTVTKGIYQDVDGNGVRDQKDEYGFIITPEPEGYLYAFDAPILQKDEDGLKVVAKNDKVVSIVETMYDFMYNQESTLVVPTFTDGKETDTAAMLAEGHALTVVGAISRATEEALRETETDYGIIPLPKYSEEQKNFRCFATGEYMAVPITHVESRITGLVFEALNAEGYRQIIPTYEEIALKQKYLRDEESGKMFDLILDSYTTSFTFNYDNWEGFAMLFGKLFNVNGGTKDVVSYLERNMKVAERRARKVTEGFINYNQG